MNYRDLNATEKKPDIRWLIGVGIAAVTAFGIGLSGLPATILLAFFG